MRMAWLLSFSCAVLLIALLSGVRGAGECSDQTTCATCISSPLACTWCYDRNYNGVRCLPPDMASSCPTAVENPDGNVSLVQDEPLSETVQVQPQQVQVFLRPGVPESFNIQVRPAGNFPLDVYFLMDFSGSMRDDLDTVQEISRDITDTINTLTSDFQVGFGSFIDKPTNPFFSASQLSRPADQSYSFKHIVKLTSNTQDFIDAVNAESNSGNFDYPEGGFDGLLQAIVCTDESRFTLVQHSVLAWCGLGEVNEHVIGWRSNARHLLIYITDAGFHHAADGYLGGALRPNRGVCHMSNATTPVYYELSLDLDFPSVSQIYSLLVQEEIIPIFSCTSDFLSRYQSLVREIPGASAAELTSDSSNLLSIIRDEYSKISSTVQLSFDAVPGLQVRLDLMSCSSPASPDPSDPAVCNSVGEGQMVEYRVTMQITELTPAVMNLQRLPLRVVVFGTVNIDVNLVLECGCAADRVNDSSECSNAGTLDCGICDCNPGRAGENCICSVATLMQAKNTCPLGDNGAICSGNGQCVCAQCVCNKRNEEEFFFGDACQCNNFNCPLNTEGVRCSGRGTCLCDGTCACDVSLVSNKPYTGDICECSPDTDRCINPADISQSICQNVGTCECNRCNCDAGFQGDLCEICDSDTSCALQTCTPLSDNCLNCLLAISSQTVVLSGSECNADCPNITFVSEQPPASTEGGVDTFMCDAVDVSDGDLCSGAKFYVPRQNKERTTVYVQTQAICTESQFSAEALGSVLGALLFIIIVTFLFLFGIIICLCTYHRKQKNKKASTTLYDTVQNDIPLQHNPAYATVSPVMPVSTATNDSVQDDNVYLQQNPAYGTLPTL